MGTSASVVDVRGAEEHARYGGARCGGEATRREDSKSEDAKTRRGRGEGAEG